MAQKPQFDSSKVSNVAGKVAEKKKDGYASGPVPDSMIGNKPGKVERQGYTGPSVARASRG